jgi:hypothetical protein
MPISYPDGFDNFTNPEPTDSLNSETVPHATQHADLNDAVEAIETVLGVNPQGDAMTVRARLDTLDGISEANINAIAELQGIGLDPLGGDLALVLAQITVEATDELVAGEEPGEVDDSAPVGFVRIDVDGTDYAFAVYAINPPAEPE